MAHLHQTTVLQNICDEIIDFADDLNRIHADSPAPDKVCCPQLDRPLANRTWLSCRCILVFAALSLLLIAVFIFLTVYCNNAIPCQ